jgi:hypothetical protein
MDARRHSLVRALQTIAPLNNAHVLRCRCSWTDSRSGWAPRWSATRKETTTSGKRRRASRGTASCALSAARYALQHRRLGNASAADTQQAVPMIAPDGCFAGLRKCRIAEARSYHACSATGTAASATLTQVLRQQSHTHAHCPPHSHRRSNDLVRITFEERDKRDWGGYRPRLVVEFDERTSYLLNMDIVYNRRMANKSMAFNHRWAVTRPG